MPDQGRSGWLVWRISWSAVLLFPLAAAPAVAASSRLDDAELADVMFVDRDHGWAVGDRGVIWHTADGGRHWRLQTSQVGCRLETVFFLDRFHGWAAGGTSKPYTGSSQGVLLRTRDGGRNWTVDQRQAIPWIRKLKFNSPAEGAAFGRVSPLFPAGVFTTAEGGRNWIPLPGAIARGWLGGDFVDSSRGAVVGAAGSAAVLAQLKLTKATAPATIGNLRDVSITKVGGWAVGDGGTVLGSWDAGKSWRPIETVPPSWRRHFDWHTVTAAGSRCWMAGTPGSRIAMSEDSGRTWQTAPTGQTLPIRKIFFLDERLGWCAGSLGTILATRDGGRSWDRQRGGGKRAALVGFYPTADAIPLEMFAQLSGNDGYLAVAQVIGRRDLFASNDTSATLAERTHEAIVGVGGSAAETAWQFPVRDPALRLSADRIVELWDRANQGEGLETLKRHLVRQLRTWRPDVVNTPAAAPHRASAIDVLLKDVVLEAVEAAADPAAFAAQIEIAGLRPWKVKKVLATLPGEEVGPISLVTAQLATRLGGSLADHCDPARALLNDRFRPPPGRIGFRAYVDHLPQGVGQRGFFSGISMAPGGESRRRLAETPPESVNLMRRMAQRNRNLRAIFAAAERNQTLARQLPGQLKPLLAEVDKSNAANMLYQVAQRFHAGGHGELAAEALDMLIKHHPEHPLAPAALTWLVQYWSSGEIAWQVNERSISTSGSETLGQVLPKPGPRSLPEPAGVSAAPPPPRAPDKRLRRAVEFGTLIERNHPTIYNEPEVRFPLASSLHRIGMQRQAERYYLTERRSARQDAWRRCADAERFVQHLQGSPPKKLIACRGAAQRPRLDGQLDDAVWEDVKAIELTSALRDDESWPARVQVAADGEFLYLAVQCRRAAQIAYKPTTEPRPRDPDLTSEDRLEIYLDIDRDWTTWYRLSVDHRGFVAEDCWYDSTWNPTWYVAAAGDDHTWTVEAAIAWDQLAAKPPAKGSVWALGLQRIVPGAGFQSWTHPAAVRARGEGFGLLQFGNRVPQPATEK